MKKFITPHIGYIVASILFIILIGLLFKMNHIAGSNVQLQTKFEETKLQTFSGSIEQLTKQMENANIRYNALGKQQEEIQKKMDLEMESMENTKQIILNLKEVQKQVLSVKK